jgi:hypothetical protein
VVTNTGGDDDDTNPPPPPPVTDVKIVVRDATTPQAGVRVIFANADDSIVSDTMTGADGSADAELPNGGNLTVIRTYPPDPMGGPLVPSEVYSYVGVKAGDRLELGHASDSKATPAAINVVLPSITTGPANIMTPCGVGTGAAPNVPITVKACDAMVDYYVTDQDNASLYKSLAYGPNADLSAETFSDPLAATITIASPVDPTIQVSAEIEVVAGDYKFFSTNPQRIDQTAASVELPQVTGPDELLVATISGPMGTQMVTRRSLYSASPGVVDATAGLIPYMATPAFTPTAITWTESGTGTADFVVAVLKVAPDPANPNDPGYTRAIIAPHTGPMLTVPLVAVATYNPTMTSLVTGSYNLVGMTGGYDAARANAFMVSGFGALAPTGGYTTLSYATGAAPAL